MLVVVAWALLEAENASIMLPLARTLSRMGRDLPRMLVTWRLRRPAPAA